jgi:hypothetical protein
MTIAAVARKNLDYLLSKQELLEQEVEIINKGKESLLTLGFGFMTQQQALELKQNQKKVLQLLRVWTVPEIEQAGELLRSRMCKPCQRAYGTDEQPACKADFERFVNAIMIKRTLAA